MSPPPPDETQVEYLDDASRSGRITPWIAIGTLVVTVVVMLALALVRPPPTVRADQIVDIYRPPLATSLGNGPIPSRSRQTRSAPGIASAG